MSFKIKIDDKKLIAYCNFSNLKLEYINNISSDVDSAEEKIYNIYKLLNDETNAMGTADINLRGFVQRYSTSEDYYNKIDITPTQEIVYSSIDQLKKDGGIIILCMKKPHLEMRKL